MRVLLIGAILAFFSINPIIAEIDQSAFKKDIDAIKTNAKDGKSVFALVHDFSQKYKDKIGSVAVEVPAPTVTMRDKAGKKIASFDGLASTKVLAATQEDAANVKDAHKEASVTLAGAGGIGDLISGVLGTVMNVGMGLLGSL
jgi:hypothetical protein